MKTKEIIIESKKHGRFTVLIDEEDWDRVKQHNWGPYAIKSDGTFYVATSVPHPDGGTRPRGGTAKGTRPRETRISLHRFLMDCPKGLEVDHINHNKLDNRKENLRVCTRAENAKNLRKRPGGSSRFKGVTYSNRGPDMINDRSKPWVANIRADGEAYPLGMYATEEEAALVYDNAAKKYHGAFANLNFPEGPSKEVLATIELGRANLPKQTSKYYGVVVEKSAKDSNRASRPAKICMNIDGKIKHYGSYCSEEEAALVRDQKVAELGLKNRTLNFPKGPSDEILIIIEAAKREYEAKLDKQFIYETKYANVENPKGKPYYVMFWNPRKKKNERLGSYWTYEEAKSARDEYLNNKDKIAKLNFPEDS